MGIFLVVSLALCAWIIGWSFGFGGFDSLMPAICVMLLALAVKIGSSYFPKRGHRAD
mgnify:CR=1 FL=1